KSNEEALETIMQAIKDAGYKPGEEVKLAMDAASSEFYNRETGKYELKGEGVTRTSEEMVSWYEEMITKYP
ncbi:phosphopyruvate hydratase, partial [Escherichia coli]|nr:phosphopyruvate hydratase [Escherichia coli]